MKATKPTIQSFWLDELNPAVYNPRTISDEALRGLSKSLARFGLVEPIIVNVQDNRNVIVGGHQRYKALINLLGNEQEIDCVVVDLSEPEEKLLNITLNNPEIQGDFDLSCLTSYIDDLKADFPDDTLLELRINELQEDVQMPTTETIVKPDVEFTTEVLEANNYLVFTFDNIMDWQAVSAEFGIETVKALDSKDGYKKQGIGRVLAAGKLIEALGLHE